MNVTQYILNTAEKHVSNGAEMASSAELCLSDAKKQIELGNYKNARRWAIESLRYSVGVFHEEYKRCLEIHLEQA